MNALRSLLLALFVLLVGCTASKPPARQPAAKGPPLSTVQPAPLPPPPPPMAKPGATADRVLREAAPACSFRFGHFGHVPGGPIHVG